MKLSRDEVLHIARLARLGMAESEIDRLGEQLSNILENFEVLQQVDTSDIPPTAQSVALQSVMRDDKIETSLPASEILANAPRRPADQSFPSARRERQKAERQVGEEIWLLQDARMG